MNINDPTHPRSEAEFTALLLAVFGEPRTLAPPASPPHGRGTPNTGIAPHASRGAGGEVSAAPRMESLAWTSGSEDGVSGVDQRPARMREDKGDEAMTTKAATIIANEFLTFDDVRADLRTLRDMDDALGYTEEGYRFRKEHGPMMKALEGIIGWAYGKDELRAAMKRAIRSGHLVRGNPPRQTEAERVCLEYQSEIACGVWVYTNPQGEVIGAEVVDFPSHDGAGWRGWKLAA